MMDVTSALRVSRGNRDINIYVRQLVRGHGMEDFAALFPLAENHFANLSVQG
jgi:hypothetical protein